MKIIILSKKFSHCRSFNLNAWAAGLLLTLLLSSIVISTLFILVMSGQYEPPLLHSYTLQLKAKYSAELASQEATLQSIKQENERKLTALTLRMAEMQSKMVRIDALGERLTQLANIDSTEFDFSAQPALGGPELSIQENALETPNFIAAVDTLSNQVDNRQHQLEALEALMANRKMDNQIFVAGRPLIQGWTSSQFGRRTDPFSGKIAFHSGLDFTGKMGTDIIAVASGVVAIPDGQNGYGLNLEINHGGGYKTLYAHCSKLLVKAGDVVKKGQIIALLGNTGRSTSPHLHFEVHKDNVAVNPASFINRTHR